MAVSLTKSVLWSCLLTWLLSGCSYWGTDEVQKLNGYSMGTSFTVSLVTKDSTARALDGEVRTVIEEVNRSMSTYLPSSDVSRFNEAGVDEWVTVSAMTVEVVTMALAVAEVSNGAFDPTVGPLVDLWGFGPKPSTDQVPDQAKIDEVRRNIGWQAIEVDETGKKLLKTEPRELDLSGIAKGYAVDQVAKLVENRGVDNYLVEIGGEMRFAGSKPDDQPWRVAIEAPDPEQRSVYKVLEVTEGAMATSGDYRNFFDQDGVRYSHTLDPATGYPINHKLVSVTLLGDRCALADAYATAFLVMGTESALELAESEGMAVYLIERDDTGDNVIVSDQFEALYASID